MKIMQHDLESCHLDLWPQGITSLAKRKTHTKFSWDHVRGLWDIEDFSLWPRARWPWPLSTMGTTPGPSLIHLPSWVEIRPRISEIFKIFQYDLDLRDLDLWPHWVNSWAKPNTYTKFGWNRARGLGDNEDFSIWPWPLWPWPLTPWDHFLAQT